jgi:hypothetical protein
MTAADTTAPEPPSNPMDSRAVLQYLIALWDTHPLQGDVAIRPTHQQAALSVWALTFHAVDCARGVLTLYEAGQPIPAVPVVRLLLEDAVTAGWLTVFPAKHRALLRDGVDQRKKLYRELVGQEGVGEFATEQLAEAEALAEVLRDAGGYVLEQRMRDLKDTDGLYTHYRLLTGQSHAGVGVVDMYVSNDDRSSVGVSLDRFGSLPAAGGIIGIAASMLLLAMIAWDCTKGERLWEHELTELARRRGTTSEWLPANPGSTASSSP